jgi:hypothetical protein
MTQPLEKYVCIWLLHTLEINDLRLLYRPPNALAASAINDKNRVFGYQQSKPAYGRYRQLAHQAY